jgi:hypothetical protein
MGIFSKFKDILGPDAGTLAGIGAGAFFGGASGALIGGSLAQLLFAGDEQVKALREAGKIEEANRLALEKYRRFVISETTPGREAGRRAIAALEAEASGESPTFQREFERGTGSLRSQFEARGKGGSTTEALALGEFTSALSGREATRKQSILSSLAGLSESGLGLGVGPLQLEAGAANRFAQTTANIGGIESAGQSAFLGDLLQLGLYSQFLKRPGTRQATPERVEIPVAPRVIT